MKTKEAVAFVLKEYKLSKYRLAKNLGVVSSTSVNQWLTQSRMSQDVANRFESLYHIKISDAYDSLSTPD